MQADSPAISNDLQDGAGKHSYREAPCTMSDAEKRLSGKTQSEEDYEHSVGWDAGQVIKIAWWLSAPKTRDRFLSVLTPSYQTLVILCAVRRPNWDRTVVRHSHGQ